MQFPVMTVTNEGKNLMSEAVQSGNKIKFEEIIISSKYIADTTPIEDMEALTYTWFTTGATTIIRGDVTKVTLQTDDAGKSFINISGEIFPNGAIVSVNAYTLAITARIGAGSLKLFGISKTSGTKTILTFGASGTTKIHVSANISTASVGGNIIAYTFDSNYVTGDDFEMLSQTLRSDVEVAKRSDLANRHYYNNPLDAVRYSSHMNSFKLRSGLYPELSLDMKGDAAQPNNPLTFQRFEHERYSLALGHAIRIGWDDPQICISGRFIKADGTVVAIQDRLDNSTSITTSTLYQDTFPQGGAIILNSDLLISYDDETLDTELILELEGYGTDGNLVASINPRTGVMNWIKTRWHKLFTSLGYLDWEREGESVLKYRLYKNASNKHDASRFAYTWTADVDQAIAPGLTFGDCTILDIALFNNEPYLIMKDADQEIPAEVIAVPHDLVNGPSSAGITIQLSPNGYAGLTRCMSNYLIFQTGVGDYALVCPFKSVPNDSDYEIKELTVITDYGYKELNSISEFDTTPSEITPNTDYTVLCKQRVDTDIKYVVCNGRLIPHID